MTTTICNICHTPIPNDRHHIAKLPEIKFSPDDAHQFMAESPKTCCQFNTTDFAICQPCLMKAFKEAVAKL